MDEHNSYIQQRNKDAAFVIYFEQRTLILGLDRLYYDVVSTYHALPVSWMSCWREVIRQDGISLSETFPKVWSFAKQSPTVSAVHLMLDILDEYMFLLIFEAIRVLGAKPMVL